MPHINHRRGETRRSVHRFMGGLTPYDIRGWKVPNFRVFRAAERLALQRILTGDDPDSLIFPSRTIDNDDVWNYD